MRTLPKKMKIMKNKGFSLLELLIVLAIISILFSILMPALSRARKEAHDFEERAYGLRSYPLLVVVNEVGIEMGLGFYKEGEPFLYHDDKKVKNSQMMQYTFGFQKLQNYVEGNNKAFGKPYDLTPEERDLLVKCGFVEYRAWVSENE